MTMKTLNQHVEITPGISSGKPRIAGHRITVENIVIWHERLGKSADEIASDYDITLADVYAALAYYFDHRHEIDQSLEESRAFVNILRQKFSSKLAQKTQKLTQHGEGQVLHG
ncbi:MAG: DUF433 domain-containing protein [Opitutae bacterium]|nr:DUF433 domain-containing protein [Opitutae bacterium]MBC9889228.1 DUF433 domain-containing protein [Opitutae bacterium]